jgi:hypothetical protein
MIKRERARRLMNAYVVLVALHSYAVGSFLMFATRWGAAFGGWGDVQPLFFARQAGIFHFVVATGYLVEYFRHDRITLMLIAKSTAVLFLTAMFVVDDGPWAVPLSAVSDGAMALIAWWLHRLARPVARA